LACERSLERLREKGASEKELRVQKACAQTIRSEIAGAELSVAGPKSRAGNVSSTRFSRPATMTAGPRHSTLFPNYDTSLPDSEVENRGKLAP